MKKAILIFLAVATVAAGIFWVVKARQPSSSEAQADFCDHLTSYGEAVASMRLIDQKSTVQELKDAQQAVQESWDELHKSASLLKTAKLYELEVSNTKLENTIQNFSNNTNLAEAQTEIYLAALNTLANTLAEDQAGCKYTGMDASASAELLP